MYDAIVVGARCAGSPTAMLLAQKGHRVLFVDRATFPSDTISTHGITYRGLVKLNKWGLYQSIKATDCPEIIKRTSDLEDFPLSGDVPKAADGLPCIICPRRTLLDKILVDAAAEAGAELREGFSVRDILSEGCRVTGIKGKTRDGRMRTEKAKIVIGADGKNSLLARAVNAPKYKEVPPLLCWYYTYWTDVQDHGLGSYSRQGRKMLFMPTNSGLTCIAVGWPHVEFPRVRANLEREYMDAIPVLSPEVAARVTDSTRAERYYGIADLSNFFRKPYGPGWALVGDAGYHKDPVLAHGIADAFRDVDLLAEAVHAGLSGEKPMEEALAEYERRRNEDAFPLYEQNCRVASFHPLFEEELRIRAALRGASQEDINTFLGVRFGTLPRETFFNPENLARIFRDAERRTDTSEVTSS